MADTDGRVSLFRARAVLPEAGWAGRPADALAVAGGRVAAVGPFGELSGAWPDADVVDLGRRWVIPGLEDAHCHPTIAADELCHVSLSPRDQRDPLRVAAAVGRAGRSNGWVKLVGWLEERCGGAAVDRRLLDRLCPADPLVVVHANGHWGYANTAGLARMGFADDTGAVIEAAVPANGWVETGSDGLATGRVFEQAMFDIMEPALARHPGRVALAGFEDRLAALRRIQRDYVSRGVTALTEALCGETGWDLLERIQAEGASPRYSALAPVGDPDLARGLAERGGPRLRLIGLKSFVDGALNGGTCLLSEPVPDGDPQQLRTADDVARELRLADSLGLLLAVHANGDAAIDVLLRASERTGLRGRIEHGSVVRDDQVPVIRRQGWGVVPFGSYVHEHGERLADTYGRVGMGRLIRHRTLVDAGVPVGGSSDYPCAGPDPWQGMWSCVTRRSREGEVLGEQERLTPVQALRLYTRGSASVRPGSGPAGTLRPGAPADFAVLDADPRRQEGLEAQLGAPVAATFVAGAPVYAGHDVEVSGPEWCR
ncbi:amidohydrolase [Nonomuraea sp. NPDC050478]|uniref:amidohydrolase n=1 Tax=Nonomuraea sp. NPDC050478 TaxID=3364365 RepID=UPI0037AE8EF3